MIIIGRLILKSWINHLTLYSSIWTLVLWLYSLRLVAYYPIITEAWIMIFSAWFMLYIGTGCVLLINAINKNKTIERLQITGLKNENEDMLLYIKYLKIAIIILSAVSFVGIIIQWLILIKHFGSIAGILVQGGKVYQLRVRDPSTTKIPYITSLYLVAINFAGIYAAMRRKFTIVIFIPFILAIIQSIGAMGRAGLLFSAVLFLSSYLIFSKTIAVKNHRKLSFKSIIITLAILAMLAITADYIKTLRFSEIWPRKYFGSKSFSKLQKLPFFTPSVYIYLSANPVVFSEYLKSGGENTYLGWYTFAPIYHLLAKVGLVKITSYYQKFYLTPVPSNTGTYLRELHADFKEVGVLLYPFLLGILCTYLYIKPIKKLWQVVTLSNLYVIVVLSYAYNAMFLGGWVLSFIVALVSSLTIQHFVERSLYRPFS
jgi:oligosaccharide repeat unit polymerase